MDRLGLLLLSALFLAGCKPAMTPSADEASVATHRYSATPCWLNQPYSARARGVVAITSQYGGGGDLLALSRRQALETLADLFDLQLQDELDVSGSTFVASGQTLRLAPSWTQDGQHYSYAYFADPQADAWVRQSCQPAQCAPERCSPSWLCNESQEHLSTVTVSQLSANLREQYRFLFENALAQYQALHGVQVQAERTQLHRQSASALRIETSLREMERTQLEFASVSLSHPLVLTHSCRIENTIYGRFELLGYAPQITAFNYPADWHLNPVYQEGWVIGQFSGLLSRNLISLKIQEAVNHGLLALARTQHTHISSDQFQVERNAAGHYMMQFVHETTRGEVRAQVRSVRFTGSAQDPQVFVLMEALP